jgi:peroxiredoxin Q/BCP
MQTTAPQIGQPLPLFSLPAVLPDGSETTLSNADFAGRVLVLFIYPKDATCGCTVEVCGFRDLYPEFEKLNAAVVGMSRDGVGPHKKFIAAQGLPYPLLSDKAQTLLKSWNIIYEATMYGKPVTKVSRDTLIVDSNGIVRHILPKDTPLGHAQEVLELVRAL